MTTTGRGWFFLTSSAEQGQVLSASLSLPLLSSLSPRDSPQSFPVWGPSAPAPTQRLKPHGWNSGFSTTVSRPGSHGLASPVRCSADPRVPNPCAYRCFPGKHPPTSHTPSPSPWLALESLSVPNREHFAFLCASTSRLLSIHVHSFQISAKNSLSERLP